MARNHSTRRDGSGFTEQEIEAVWQKGQIIPNTDSRRYRFDACGALMDRWAYGSTSTYGWEIDHIYPVSAGGTDILSNLQPLQWQNNRHKSDNLPGYWNCAVTYR